MRNSLIIWSVLYEEDGFLRESSDLLICWHEENCFEDFLVSKVGFGFSESLLSILGPIPTDFY